MFSTSLDIKPHVSMHDRVEPDLIRPPPTKKKCRRRRRSALKNNVHISPRSTNNAHQLRRLHQDDAVLPANSDGHDLARDAHGKQAGLADEGPARAETMDQGAADEQVDDAADGGAHAEEGNLRCGGGVYFATGATVRWGRGGGGMGVAVEGVACHYSEDIDDTGRH